jgi:nucleoside-diphosphate-sugar epimerase
MPNIAAVFGGAGFVGSNICRALAAAGWKVRAIDGLMARTFADARLLDGIAGVKFVHCVTDESDRVPELVNGAGLIVDAMGWTRHLEAIRNPAYDLRLNVASHLPVIRACAQMATAPGLVIHLASRHQYGRPARPVIDEDSPMEPLDVQGVHKVAAERHWQLFAGTYTGVAVASLRFGNTYGPGQPAEDGDIGLIGGFVRTALRGERITIFGTGRRRNVLYAPDLAQSVLRLSAAGLGPGFTPLNVSGCDIAIRELAQAIIDACGSGTLAEEEMPEDLARIDIGEVALDDSRLCKLIGPMPLTPPQEALRATVANVRLRLKREPLTL